MRILIVEDDKIQAENLNELIISLGYECNYTTNSIEAYEILQSEKYDLVLLDLKMPNIDGMTLLRKIIQLKLDTRVVIITAFGSIESAVEAMKHGAYDYLVKPVEENKLKELLELVKQTIKMSEMAQLSAPTANLEKTNDQTEGYFGYTGFLASDPSMLKIKDIIKKIASLSTTVLIYGETGTGKEVVARAIHYESSRRNKPFVTVNCANLQPTLLESELFGHEKGAFTDANYRKLGKFELASGGTLFLDEIGELPLQLQAKLLRAIQEQEIERVGGTKPIKVDVRLISATNRNLPEMVENGKFRKDLFYRLNVFPIRLPPLRERLDDIPILAQHFLNEFSQKNSKRKYILTDSAISWLKSQKWPGNIRELKNIIERVAILDIDGYITQQDLETSASLEYFQNTDRNVSSNNENCTLTHKLEESEKNMIIDALNNCGGNVLNAAKYLGIPRRTLYEKLKKYNINPANYRIKYKSNEK